MEMGLDHTDDNVLALLFPNVSSELISRFSAIVSCLASGESFLEKFLEYVANGGFPITIEEQLPGDGDPTEYFVFDVVNGRSGSVATAVDGATIDAGSTIELQYSLVENPGADDWKTYEDGSITGSEMNKEVEFVGRQNRVAWTPNNSEDLNVMVSL